MLGLVLRMLILVNCCRLLRLPHCSCSACTVSQQQQQQSQGYTHTAIMPTYYQTLLLFTLYVQDFYNLVDVYLDAVLHPRCISDKRTFEQEGWHLELEDPKDDLSFKGVVFNEMKGVYSSPDSMFYRTVQRALFPDNTYRHDSGGDPEDIPNLTFEQFQVRMAGRLGITGGEVADNIVG